VPWRPGERKGGHKKGERGRKKDAILHYAYKAADKSPELDPSHRKEWGTPKMRKQEKGGKGSEEKKERIIRDESFPSLSRNAAFKIGARVKCPGAWPGK